MSAISPHALPAWVYKRDGRLVPFDADKICQAIFAATETLGRPDAFMARELTDGVLHFLAAETTATPTTAQVAETVAKVVRELGQPALARVFAEGGKRPPQGTEVPPARPEVLVRFSPLDPPSAVVKGCLSEYSLRAVFSRDLVAAHGDGLVTLTGLEAPLDLAACVLRPRAGLADGLLSALTEARGVTAGWVALDGPEHALPGGAEAAQEFVGRLTLGLQAVGLRAIVNLNCASAPTWAEDGAEGPLFAEQRPISSPPRPEMVAEALLDGLRADEAASTTVHVHWHLAERDFAPAEACGARLVKLARCALDCGGLSFTLDRPRRPVALGAGLDRKHPAVLLAVGLHLPRLAEMPGVGGNPEQFLHKLPSLTRLALSAAARKRAFLRKQSRGPGGAVAPVGRGFLLDRARLVVVPVGLESAVRQLQGRGLCDSKTAVELARQIVQCVRGVLKQEGATGNLDACLHGAGGSMEHWWSDGTQAAPEKVSGLTPWEPAAAPRSQLRAASALHAAAEGGTAVVLLPRDPPVSAEEVAELLRFAWKQTEVAHLRLVRLGGRQQQLTLPGLQE